MRKRKEEWVEHVDSKWIDTKIGGHGGGYTFDTVKGVATIDFIFGKNFLKIFWYNVILFVKYIIRNIK